MKLSTLVVMLAACGGGRGKAPVSEPSPSGLTILPNAPPDAVTLDVRAVHWACTIAHAHGVKSDTLKVPMGRPVKLHVWSPEVGRGF